MAFRFSDSRAFGIDRVPRNLNDHVFWRIVLAVGVGCGRRAVFLQFQVGFGKEGLPLLVPQRRTVMFEMDHVAVPANDVPATARFYVEHFGATVLYQDDTWAFLK